MPARTRGRVELEQRIGHFHARQDQRIVGAAQPEAHQLQEVDAHLRAHGQARIAAEVPDRHGALGQPAVLGRGLRRGDAHVVSRHAVEPCERPLADRGPVLEARIPVVGERERERGGVGRQVAGARHEGRDAHRECEGVETRILLPAVLIARGALPHEEGERAPNHVRDFGAVQRAALIERHREQHRKGGLIELHAEPVALAVEPLVLMPVSVLVLRGDEVAQRVARFARRPDREQCAGALDQIARPHQVIARAFLARVAPGHAQGSHHGAGKSLVLVGAQHHGGDAHLRCARLGEPRGERGFRRAARVPERPALALPLPRRLKRLRQRRQRQGCRGLGARAEAEREHRLSRQLAEERDIARSGALVFPGERAVTVKVLPAVALAHEARARPAPRVAPPGVDRREREGVGTLLRPQEFPTAMPHDGRAVVRSGAAEVRREERVRAQRRIAAEPHLDEEHIAVLAGRDAQREIEARVVVHDAHPGCAGRGELELVLPQPFHLDPEPRAVANDEPEVADLRQVDARVVDLVDDAAADGEPQARGPERAADHLLGAAAPGGRQSRSSRRRAHLRAAGRSPGACAPPMSIARIALGVLPRAIMRHRFSPDSTPLTIEPPREKKERQTVASAALASGRLPGEGSAGSRGIHRGIGRGRRGGVAAGLHVT